MKGALDRTKVVLRHLPPSISQATLLEHVDGSYAGRYNFFSFHSGKTSQKRQCYSRAYINFNKPEDVVDFSEFFGGHVFVNEKGSQFKVIVEYSPSQRIPKQCSKIDGREGTIFKDTEYLEFLEIISKPVENLPSAELQLDRREAERAGAGKDAVIVTPLMDFVRQKRATKSGFRRSLPNGKVGRRATGASTNISGSTSTKRGSEKKKNSSAVYVQRESTKVTGGKEKPPHVPFHKQNALILGDKVQSEVLEEESGIVGPGYSKKKVLLLKGKEQNISHVAIPDNHHVSAKNPASLNQIQRNDRSGKAIRKILKNKDARLVQPVSLLQTENLNQFPPFEKDRRPRSSNTQLNIKDKGIAQDKPTGIDRKEKYSRSKDNAWPSFRHSDGLPSNDEFLSSPSMHTQSDVLEGNHGDLTSTKTPKFSGGGRNTHHSSDNGSHKHAGHRPPPYNLKDVDGFPHVCESKSSKRAACNYGSHEKQVWVQKPSPGS